MNRHYFVTGCLISALIAAVFLFLPPSLAYGSNLAGKDSIRSKQFAETVPVTGRQINAQAVVENMVVANSSGSIRMVRQLKARLESHLRDGWSLDRLISSDSAILLYRFLGQVDEDYGYLPVQTKVTMSFAYTPTVGKIAEGIADGALPYRDYGRIPYNKNNQSKNYFKEAKVDVQDVEFCLVSDGTAVLGLGNVGCKAMGPVAERKGSLLRWFAGLSISISMIDNENWYAKYKEAENHYKELINEYGGNKQAEVKKEILYTMSLMDTMSHKAADNIIRPIKKRRYDLAKRKVGLVVMLEDIAAPVCYIVEKELNKVGIPAIHDDQHGTAIVLAGAVINALKKAGKDPQNSRIIINGAGASASCVAGVLKEMGVGDIIMYDTQGAIFEGRPFMTADKRELSKFTNKDGFQGKIEEALIGADGFIGLSQKGFFKGREEEMLKGMNGGSFVFACANPDPEFDCEEILRLQKDGALENIAVIGAGRFGLSPEIIVVNNCFSFGVFRALFDFARRQKIIKGISPDEIATLDLAAAYAIAKMAEREGRILPLIFSEEGYNADITQEVAMAVAGQFASEDFQGAYDDLALQLKDEHNRLYDALPEEIKEVFSLLEGFVEPSAAGASGRRDNRSRKVTKTRRVRRFGLIRRNAKIDEQDFRDSFNIRQEMFVVACNVHTNPNTEKQTGLIVTAKTKKGDIAAGFVPKTAIRRGLKGKDLLDNVYISDGTSNYKLRVYLARLIEIDYAKRRLKFQIIRESDWREVSRSKRGIGSGAAAGGQFPGQLRNSFCQIDKFVPEEVRQRIIEAACGQNLDGVFASGGRSLIVELKKPIHIGHHTINAIKLKGAGSIDEKSKGFLPPQPVIHKGRGSVATAITVTPDGRFVFMKDVAAPVRGMGLQDAQAEYENSRQLSALDLSVLYPLGFSQYDNMHFLGMPMGFAILGLGGKEQDTQRLDRMELDEDIAAKTGRQLARMHNKGFAHRYSHLGNFSFFEGEVFILDLNNAIDISRITFEQKAAYRFWDILYVLSTLNMVFLGETKSLAMVDLLSIGIIEAFLNGYFSECGYDIKNDLKTIAENCFTISAYMLREVSRTASETPLVNIGNWLVNALKRATSTKAHASGEQFAELSFLTDRQMYANAGGSNLTRRPSGIDGVIRSSLVAGKKITTGGIVPIHKASNSSLIFTYANWMEMIMKPERDNKYAERVKAFLSLLDDPSYDVEFFGLREEARGRFIEDLKNLPERPIDKDLLTLARLFARNTEDKVFLVTDDPEHQVYLYEHLISKMPQRKKFIEDVRSAVSKLNESGFQSSYSAVSRQLGYKSMPYLIRTARRFGVELAELGVVKGRSGPPRGTTVPPNKRWSQEVILDEIRRCLRENPDTNFSFTWLKKNGFLSLYNKALEYFPGKRWREILTLAVGEDVAARCPIRKGKWSREKILKRLKELYNENPRIDFKNPGCKGNKELSCLYWSSKGYFKGETWESVLTLALREEAVTAYPGWSREINLIQAAPAVEGRIVPNPKSSRHTLETQL